MSPAERWLRDHVPEAPPRLLTAMIDALPIDADRVPDALAAGAMALYGRASDGSGGREDALPLLAADALFTHAFEAEAQLNPRGVREFAAAWSGDRGLGSLVEEEKT